MEHMPRILINSFVEDNASVVLVKCNGEITKNVEKTLREFLEEKWKDDVQSMEEELLNEYGDDGYHCVDYSSMNSPLVKVQKSSVGNDDNILFWFSRICIKYNGGDNCDFAYECDIVKSAFKHIKSVFPNISFTGMITFCWSDHNGGDVVDFFIADEESDDSDEVNTVLTQLSGMVIDEAVQKGELIYFLKDSLYGVDENGQELDALLDYLDTRKPYICSDSMRKIRETCLRFVENNKNLIERKDLIERLRNN